MKVKVAIVLVILLISSSVSYGFFLDLNNHWSDDAIYWATYDKKLFNGYPDGTFRPEEHITRAQYIALLNRVLERKNIYRHNNIDITLNYLDLDKGHWAYKEIGQFINAIDRLGFTSIRLEDIFPGDRLYPNRSITRYEAALLARTVTTPPIEVKQNTYNDVSEELVYFDELTELINNGILLGYMNDFRLYDNITRAESATIIQRIYKDLDYITNNYLGLLPVEEGSNKKYPLFLVTEYSGRLSSDDQRFVNSVTSLEYREFIGYIPFEEQHLYDQRPIETLWDLKSKGYYNLLGLNYYILRYDKSLDITMRATIIEETLDNYIKMENKYVDGIYHLLYYVSSYSNFSNKEVLIKAIEKYYNSLSEPIEKVYGGILLSETYYKHNNIQEAKRIYRSLLNLENLQTDMKMHLILNYSYLEYTTLGKEKALNFINDSFSQLKLDRQYNLYSNELEFKYASFVKQLLMKP